MSSSDKKTNTIFYKITVIGLLFLSLFLFVNTLLYSRLALAVAALGNKLEAICGCTNHWTFSAHPWLFSSLGLAFVVALSFIIFAFVKLVRLKIRTNRFIKANLDKRRTGLSGKLKRIAQSLNLEQRIIEIKDNKPVVFCFGFIRPKICISSAFVKKLDAKELTAVLLHEQHHLSHYETMRLFIIKTITTTLFFVPGLKSLAKQYSTMSEISADEWAINNSQDKAPLAGAIYKILELNEKINSTNNLAVASFSYITEERIKKITDDNYVISIKIVKPKLLLKLFVLSGILFMFTFYVYSSKAAIIDHGNNSCAMVHSSEHQECEMLNDGSVCKMHQEGGLLENTDCQGAVLHDSSYNPWQYKF